MGRRGGKLWKVSVLVVAIGVIVYLFLHTFVKVHWVGHTDLEIEF